jgi:hypothetical protein
VRNLLPSVAILGTFWLFNRSRELTDFKHSLERLGMTLIVGPDTAQAPDSQAGSARFQAEQIGCLDAS